MPRTSTATSPRVRAVALIAVLATALFGLSAAPPAAGAQRAYIVDDSAALPAAARVLQALPLADALVVSSPVAIPGGVPADTPLRPESLAVEPDASGLRLDSGVSSTGAAEAWDTTRGERAVVALIDTGVAPVAALEGAVAGEIDFSGTGGGDGYGHGTFLASLIAGRGHTAPGVAPGAGVLSLKVGGPDGATTLGAVMSALEWLHGPGRAAGIRVAALAMGVEPGSEAAEIVDRAVEKVADAGILVVTAAGNDGPGALTSPATARTSLSVGAVDDGGTADRGDDVVADFSGAGADRAGVTQPDMVAPGVRLAGSLPQGSVIAASASADEHGLHAGTGTSMSTALVAGVAALASSARPDLDGAALAAALAAGAGELDAPATVAAALAAPSGPGRSAQARPAEATAGDSAAKGRLGPAGERPGKGQAAPGKGQATPDKGQAAGKAPDTVADPQSVRWTSVRWTSVRWTGSSWGDADWPMATWESVRWTGSGWEMDPQSVRWTSVRWTSVRWTSVRWTSVRWTSDSWSWLQ